MSKSKVAVPGNLRKHYREQVQNLKYRAVLK
jgi:hypothetical protein